MTRQNFEQAPKIQGSIECQEEVKEDIQRILFKVVNERMGGRFATGLAEQAKK